MMKMAMACREGEGYVSPLQMIMSSATGAFLTSMTMTPLDVVKVRLQSQQKKQVAKSTIVYCNCLIDQICTCMNCTANAIMSEKTWYKNSSQLNGTVDAIVKIARVEGFRSLWSGLPPTMVMAVPSAVTYYTLYDQLRGRLYRAYQSKVMDGKNRPQPLWVPLVASVSARTGAVALVTPLELVRTKMQSEKQNYAEIRAAVHSTLQNHGIRGLWRGLGATLMRDIPFSAIYWCTYETLRAKMTSVGRSDIQLKYTFLAGAVSGTVAAIITIPFDVAKTHRQIELGQMKWKDRPHCMGSTLRTLREIHAHHGVSGLYTGLVPRIAKVAPTCAIMIGTYEVGKSFFMSRNVKMASVET